MPELPAPSPLAAHWTLDPTIAYLNHGSFGACPRAVLAAQAELRAQLEAEPVRFFLHQYRPLLDQARERLATMVGADADGIGFVSNATTGVNALLATAELGPGDEVVVTDHEYPACRNALDEICRRRGATVVVARVPFPVGSEDEVVTAVTAKVGPRTRLLLIDHVTSPTALVLPVLRIIAAVGEVPVVVDGAHAPGMLELEVAELGVAAYAGNCHKWLCAPKGAGFVWASPGWRERMRPPVVSFGATADGDRFRASFDWAGTGDPTPWLAVPAAIEAMAAMVPGGWSEIRRCNRELAVAGRRLLCEALEVEAPCPASMLGSMAAVPLPPGHGAAVGPFAVEPLQQMLMDRFRIEVPVTRWPAAPSRVLRVSAQLYNSYEQYRYLAEALRELLAG